MSEQVSQTERAAISKFKLEFEIVAQEQHDNGNKKVVLTRAEGEAIINFLNAKLGEGTDGYDGPSSSSLGTSNERIRWVRDYVLDLDDVENPLRKRRYETKAGKPHRVSLHPVLFLEDMFPKLWALHQEGTGHSGGNALFKMVRLLTVVLSGWRVPLLSVIYALCRSTPTPPTPSPRAARLSSCTAMRAAPSRWCRVSWPTAGYAPWERPSRAPPNLRQ